MATMTQQGERSAAHGLEIAFMIALAIHSAGLLGLASWRSEAPKPPGVQEITIDLAPLMQEAETVEPAKVAEPQQAVETATFAMPEATAAEPRLEAVTAAEPDKVEEPAREAGAALPPPAEDVQRPEDATAKPSPQDASTVAPPPETVVTEAPAVEAPPTGDASEASLVANPEAVVAAQPPHPTRRQTRRAKLERTPVPRAVRPKREVTERPARPPRQVAAQPAASAPATAQRGRSAASRESNAASAASADPNARNRYAAMISAAVRRRLRFPDYARSRGSGGTATVRFTVHRSGRVMSASLVRSAGDGTLDRAALATVVPGSSLPAAPDAVPQQQITFVVPLRFDLR